MLVIMVGAPFEEQTLYGPFENFDEVYDFADTVKNAYVGRGASASKGEG